MSQELIWPDHKSVIILAVRAAIHDQRMSDANRDKVVNEFCSRMDRLLERFQGYDAERFPDLTGDEVALLDRLQREGRIMWRALKQNRYEQNR